MKFICLGYADLSHFAKIPEQQLQAMMNECFEYDDVLRAGGHFAGGEALQDSSKAITLRYVKGKLQVTDGPYAETKEQIGGILILEAENREHAIELMSKHPGVKTGPFEIRPADDIVNAMIASRNASVRPDAINTTDPYIETILYVFRNHLTWIGEAVADIPDARFAEQPNGVRNHPAWTLGHLSVSLGYLLNMLFESAPSFTEADKLRFSPGSTPTADRSAYPSKADLIAQLQDRHQLVDSVVRSKHREYFGLPAPEFIREMSPTVGHMAIYLLASHESYHLGQIMQWRRAAGLIPPTNKSKG